MAIKLPNLKTVSTVLKNRQNFLYKDLTLDIEQTKISSPGFTIPVPGSDIKASYDLEAIKNSLQNLFNTKPGNRFLFPEYGLNLEEFLFTAITEPNGNIIGTKILTTIDNWEPRVTVNRVDVFTDPDNNQYVINIYIQIPVLNINTVVESILDIKRQSFTVLPISQIR